MDAKSKGDPGESPDIAKTALASTADPIQVNFNTLPAEENPPDRISIRDVAKQAGVSIATVSMVLNQNPRISRGTHVRVQRVIDSMGYRPNRLAQSLSSRFTERQG